MSLSLSHPRLANGYVLLRAEEPELLLVISARNLIQLSRRLYHFPLDLLRIGVVGTLDLGTIDRNAALQTADGVNDLVPLILDGYIHLNLESFK